MYLYDYSMYIGYFFTILPYGSVYIMHFIILLYLCYIHHVVILYTLYYTPYYIRIGNFNDAKRQVEKSLELDKTYVKAWAKKGDIEFFMKE